MSAESITFDADCDSTGKIHPIGVRALRARLARWAGKKGRKCTVTIQRHFSRKTNPQLAYFHGPLIDHYSEYTGYEKDEMKWELKDAYLPKVPKVNHLTGEESMVTPSLRDVSKEVMTEFITRCLKEADLMGLRIPTPDEWLASGYDEAM
jgi:hypothetical protein